MSKRLVQGTALAIGLCVLVGTLAYTADQTILGKSFLIKDPQPNVGPTLRKIVVLGKEPAPDDLVLGDPTLPGSAGGAILEVIATGSGPNGGSQVFTMPASGWKRLPSNIASPLVGYKYVDANPGALGPVKTALIKRPPNNAPFILKVVILGANGPGAQPHITQLPPAPGDEGGVIFTIGGSERYCMTFGGTSGGKVVNAPNPTGEKVFKVVSTALEPTSEATGCPTPPTTTITTTTVPTTTTATTTSTTTTTEATTTTTTSTTTTTEPPTTTTTTTSTTTTTTPVCGTFLTKWGSLGSGDGQFNNPNGVAVDGSGNVFVADEVNNRIQKFTNTGTYLTQWGSFGTGDGQFSDPYGPLGVAVDGSGNVFVSDCSAHRIQKFTNTGTYLTQWGTLGSGDGQFNCPDGIAVDGSGNVFVADYSASNSRIQKFTDTGTFLAKWGTAGSGDGQFSGVTGVAVDASGNVFVADSGFPCRVHKFTNTGTFVVTFGTVSCGPGGGGPHYLAADASGSIFVSYGGTSSWSNVIRKYTNSGTFLTQWGVNGAGDGEFRNPTGVAVDGAGNVFVAEGKAPLSDPSNHRIQKFACP